MTTEGNISHAILLCFSVVFRKMDMNALDAAIGPVPLNFMLLLEPSVVITITSLYEIFGVTGSHKPMSGNITLLDPNHFSQGNQDIKVRFSNTTEVPAAGVPITHLLLGSDITTTPQVSRPIYHVLIWIAY